VEPLIGALSDNDASVRGWAALALARFRDPRIIEPLVKATKDPDAQVRGRAVLALRVGINNPTVRAAVEAAANDADPSVQTKARQVLGN
jgi:HEAT repeat protein